MNREKAIEHLNNIRPSLGHETNEALDAVLEGERFEVWNDCLTCLRQGCEHRQNEVIRINCPLFKRSAV